MPVKVRESGQWVEVSGASAAIPSGGIIIWSGAANLIGSTAAGGTGSGWVLCDGQNNTPDLRDRFVVGASDSTGDNTYPGLSPNATPGGSANAIVVSHSHGDGNLSAANHNHVFPGDDQLSFTANGQGGWTNRQTGTFNYDADSSTSGNGIIYRTSDSGSLDVTGATSSAGIDNTGTLKTDGSVSGTNANLPPYYALCYIMKT